MEQLLDRHLRNLQPVAIGSSETDDLESKWDDVDKITFNSAAGGLREMGAPEFSREIHQNCLDGCRDMVLREKSEGFVVTRHDGDGCTLWIISLLCSAEADADAVGQVIGLVCRDREGFACINFGYVLGPFIFACNSSTKSDKGEFMYGRRCEGVIGRHGEGINSGINAYLSYLWSHYSGDCDVVNDSLYYVFGDVRLDLMLRLMPKSEWRQSSPDKLLVNNQRLYGVKRVADNGARLPFNLPASWSAVRYTAVVARNVPDVALDLERLFLELAPPRTDRVIELRRELPGATDGCLDPLSGCTILLEPRFNSAFYLRGVLIHQPTEVAERKAGFGVNVHKFMEIGRDRNEYRLNADRFYDLLRVLSYGEGNRDTVLDFLLYMLLHAGSDPWHYDMLEEYVAPVRNHWVKTYAQHLECGQSNIVSQAFTRFITDQVLTPTGLVPHLFARYNVLMKVREGDLIVGADEVHKLTKIHKALESNTRCFRTFVLPTQFALLCRRYLLLTEVDEFVLRSVLKYVGEHPLRLVEHKQLFARLIRALKESPLHSDRPWDDVVVAVDVDLDSVEVLTSLGASGSHEYYIVPTRLLNQQYVHDQLPCPLNGDGCNCVVNRLLFAIIRDDQGRLSLFNQLCRIERDTEKRVKPRLPEPVDLDVIHTTSALERDVLSKPDVGDLVRGVASVDGEQPQLLPVTVEQGTSYDSAQASRFRFNYLTQLHAGFQQIVIDGETYFRLYMPGVPLSVRFSDVKFQPLLYHDQHDNYYMKHPRDALFPTRMIYTAWVSHLYFQELDWTTFDLAPRPCHQHYFRNNKPHLSLPPLRLRTLWDMIAHCRGFYTVDDAQFFSHKPNTMEPLEYMWNSQVGSCRHRCQAFLAMLGFAGINGIRCRRVESETHSFVELSANNGMWRQLDLGGSGLPTVARSDGSSVSSTAFHKPVGPPANIARLEESRERADAELRSQLYPSYKERVEQAAALSLQGKAEVQVRQVHKKRQRKSQGSTSSTEDESDSDDSVKAVPKSKRQKRNDDDGVYRECTSECRGSHVLSLDCSEFAAYNAKLQTTTTTATHTADPQSAEQQKEGRRIKNLSNLERGTTVVIVE